MEKVLGVNFNNTTAFNSAFIFVYRLIGLSVKVSTSGAEGQGQGSIPACAMGIFLGQVTPVTTLLALQWLHCQALGVIGSGLGLVSLVSVYFD